MVPSLSVVMPVYNSAPSLPGTLASLRAAVDAGGWALREVLVVDDGSTDGSGETAEENAAGLPLRVLSQENRGRFLARERGLREATGDFVLFLDSRVHAGAGSLRHVSDRLAEDPAAVVWNGHVTFDVHRNPYARFWRAVAVLAWPDYMRRPRPLRYGVADFDRYPKGTGFFLAPRKSLLAAFDTFQSQFDDLQNANDDTSMIRDLAATHDIGLDPGFDCTHHARGSLREFAHHSYHRGTFFVDGFLRPGSRLRWVILAFLVGSPPAAWFALRRPRRAAALVIAAQAGLGATAVARGVEPADAAALAGLAPLFLATYGAGIWRGAWLLARARLRAQAPQ